MSRILALMLMFVLSIASVSAQTQRSAQRPPVSSEVAEETIRISTSLVQADVVVTDKNDQPVSDLKLEDFELYDNGKKQNLKFMEWVSVETGGKRSDGTPLALPKNVESSGNTGVSTKDLKRVMAFVIDDLTMEIGDIPAVRHMLLDFVDNKMHDGDLVAIVRVVGGKGLLEQFTGDRQLLRRAIAAIRVTITPYSASNTPDPVMSKNPLAAPAVDAPVVSEQTERPEIFSANDDTVRYFRGLSALSTANYVINSLKLLPGRKNLILITGGVPLFQSNTAGYSNITSLLDQLTDNAFRAGVVVNTLDPRGLRATPGVVGFQATPARSALGGNDANDLTFGRGGALDQAAFGSLLAGGEDHLGLSTVAGATGGVAVVNTNNFEAGLEKIIARSSGYYSLSYSPGEKFDNRFHKLEVKVKRGGVKVYNHTRYLAREETIVKPVGKEEQIAAAVRSPLVKTDLDVTPNISVRLQPGRSAVDIHMLIDASRLHFSNLAEGVHNVSFDVVGFIFDQLGKQRGGFSETVTLNLKEDEFRRAIAEGLTYTASTALPPGYFQIRFIVRESGSGSFGTFSKYLEVPDLAAGRLAMSSVFLFAVDQPKGSKPTPLLALRRLNRKQELRYLTIVYNPKLKDGKPQLRSEVIISQGSKVLFREPQQTLEGVAGSPVTKLGQLALSRVSPGRYTLTLVVTDVLADKKNQSLAHSIDFTVVD